MLATDGPAGLGLEVNVDYLAACVVDLTGAVRHHLVAAPTCARSPPPRPGPARRARRRGPRRAPYADGLTAWPARRSPCPAWSATAAWSGSPRNLGWRNVDVPGLLAGHPLAEPVDGIPPLVHNEANLAALGELHAGPPGTPASCTSPARSASAPASCSTARSCRGTRGWSGEIGHLPVHPQGRPCRCGGQGCLEQYAGQEAILAAAGLAGADLPADRAAARLADLAEAGDPATLAALADAGTALGVAVAGVVNLLDLDTVVLGGGYAPLAPWLSPPVLAEVSRRVLTAAWAPVTVRPAALGVRSAAVGGAASVVRRIIDRPVGWLARAG